MYAVETCRFSRPLWRKQAQEHSDKLQATLHAEYLIRAMCEVDHAVEARIVDTVSGDVLSTWRNGYWQQTVPTHDPGWLKAFAPK